MQDEPRYLREAMAPRGVQPEPGGGRGADRRGDRARANRGGRRGRHRALLYDAHLYKSNKALLDAVQAGARKLGVVLMRDPWDAEFLTPGVAAVTAYGWRRCQLDAAMARLLT